MKTLSWTTAILLALATFLLSLLGTFHDDLFYHYAYQRNGAYEQLDRELVWSVTENFQSYIVDDEELLLFDEQQASHLEDVKGLYGRGAGIARILIAMLVVLFFIIAGRTDREHSFKLTLRRAGISIFILTLLIGLLALKWEWFFTVFHELLFSGNWQFSGATLMLRLWGGSFFPLAAAYILMKNILTACFLFLFSIIIGRRSASRSA